MSLYDSKIYMSDINRVIEEFEILFKSFDGTSILITGAGGLVCSAVIDLLLEANEKYGLHINIYVAGRDKGQIDKRFRKYIDNPYYHFVYYDANNLNNVFDFHADYIIHGASNSAPKDIITHGIDTMVGNFVGLYELLVYAHNENVRNTLYISTSEIYGIKEHDVSFKENEYGFIDILNPRSSYSSAKRAAETLCACFSKEKKVKTTIVRPGHIYGPTSKKTDSHVSAVFAFNAAYGKDIVLKSEGNQLRSWCYCLDSASAILIVLNKGKNANAYNISNPRSIATIREMAEQVSLYANVKLLTELTPESEKEINNPMLNSALDSEKIQALGWHGIFDLKTGLGHTVEIIKESFNNYV